MFWICVSLVIGIAIGIVIGDMLNTNRFKDLFFIPDDDEQDS